MVLGYFVVQDLSSYMIIYVVVGVCQALINVNILPLVFTHGDVHKFGANTGMYYFATQSAAIIGPLMSGGVIELMGNNFRMIWPLGAFILVFAWLSLNRIKE